MVEASKHFALALKGINAAMGTLHRSIKLAQALTDLCQLIIPIAGDMQGIGKQLDSWIASIRGIGSFNGAFELLGDRMQAVRNSREGAGNRLNAIHCLSLGGLGRLGRLVRS